MCNKQKVYRITLRSADNINTNDNDAQYFVKLPYSVKSGYLHLESIAILGGGTLLTNVTAVRVCSPSFQQKGHYYSGGATQNVLEEIPTVSYTINASDDFFYKNQVNSNSIGFPLENFDLNNKYINIQLLDQTNALLTEAQLTSYVLTFLIVDNEPNEIEY